MVGLKKKFVLRMFAIGACDRSGSLSKCNRKNVNVSNILLHSRKILPVVR